MEVKLQELRPGETVEVVFAVAGLADSETVVDASIEVRSRLGAVLITNHAVVLEPTDDGYTGSLKLSSLPECERLLINLYVTTSKGRKQFLIPLGNTDAEVKIGASRKRLTMTAQVVATKQ
jgi:hypothetical protein